MEKIETKKMIGIKQRKKKKQGKNEYKERKKEKKIG